MLQKRPRASHFLPPKNTRLCTAQLTTDLFNQTAMLLKKVRMKIFSTKGSANQQKNYGTMLFMSKQAIGQKLSWSYKRWKLTQTAINTLFAWKPSIVSDSLLVSFHPSNIFDLHIHNKRLFTSWMNCIDQQQASSPVASTAQNICNCNRCYGLWPLLTANCTRIFIHHFLQL